MKKHLIAAAALAAALPAAHAAEFKAGDWTLNLGGNINAFYTSSKCSGDNVTGLALASDGAGATLKACGGGGKATVIGNGLLPSQLSGGARSTQNGYDIAANVTISVATATDSSLGQNSTVDVRNAFMTIGKAEMGTFKLGRDYGLFGLHGVLNDMTLLGVGAGNSTVQKGRVSLGHLGAGMAYVGTYGQMVYTTPAMGGFNADIGVFSPVNVTAGGGQTAKDSPQTQARVTYAAQNFKAWASVKNQQFNTFSMNATEVGGTYSMGGLGLVANYQDGKGLGILSDGDQGDVKTQHTFVQATYKVAPATKLGLGWGKSENKDNKGTAAVKSNENLTAAVYHNITPQVTLVGEVGEGKSKAYNGLNAKQTSVSFGAIFFF